MEQFERIRRDRRDEGLSIRALSEKHKVHRRTVRQALADATPPARKVPVRVAPVLGPHVATVRRWPIADQDVPPKQRHTARRVWQRLVEEEGVVVAESSVRALVGELRREIFDQSLQVKVPQTHVPAQEAEVDFGEFAAVIGGVRMKLWMFILRLSYSGKAVHIAYANQAQESFLDGHVAAFERLGGVPAGMIRYDNLTAAVVRVVLGRERVENPRFIALRSHYGFDSFFCQPGIEGAHEKGGVEGESAGSAAVTSSRCLRSPPWPSSTRSWPPPMPPTTPGGSPGAPRPSGPPLRGSCPGCVRCRSRPSTPLRTSRAGRDARARVCVRQSYYSVPARYAGRRLHVRLGATTVTVIAAGTVVATHTRSLHKFTEDLVLDHYLEVLIRKPGALAGATALAAARRSGAFTPAHQRFWDAARADLGDRAGTRALIGVLLLHRTLPISGIVAGIEAAVAMGRFDPDLVAVEARRLGQPQAAPAVVLPLTAPPAAREQRRPPSLGAYDVLAGIGVGA